MGKPRNSITLDYLDGRERILGGAVDYFDGPPRLGGLAAAMDSPMPAPMWRTVRCIDILLDLCGGDVFDALRRVEARASEREEAGV